MGVLVPSHCLYANDILTFCNGKRVNLQALKSLFTIYASQVNLLVQLNLYYFMGLCLTLELILLLASLVFGWETFFHYLGVPVFKGKPKLQFFQPIVDMIKCKLTSYKEYLMSIARRIQLVKQVIQSMMIYSINIILNLFLSSKIWKDGLRILCGC